ncbi:TIGR02117 family protein [Mesorhizobium sp. KR9-304]|uniref:TIGR02117 family protein n=1 Tax=Mesorhizobium sp. KR9-304 TaxID=3156614 RepID=UPI0032B5F904
MARVSRWLLYILAAVALLLVAGTLVPRPLFADAGTGQASRRILVIGNPIHTDIVIPIDAGVLARFEPLLHAGIKADAPGARHLVFGWGSRAFYIETPTWADLKPGPLLSALTLDASVMHVGVAGTIDETQTPVRGFDLTEGEFERLLAFIQASFRSGADGPIPIPDSAYGEFDGFFEAEGHFNALLGCNTWAAAALREAGLRTGWWNPLPQTLGMSLDLHNSQF